jgi:hypothetical protein
MASTVKHLRSSTADKRPTASGLADGQLAINTASGTPGLFLKDNAGAVVKVGPVHVGAAAPNATPAGSSGNSKGELWVNDTTTIHGLNYYTGSAFVNLTPSGTATTAGLVELATNAETQAGTDTIRAVTPSGLQSKVSDSTSTTSSTTIASSTAVKAAFDLANAALPKSGGRVTGNLEIGPTGSLSFEGSTDDSFETFLAVVDPTADRTITFPNVTGTVVTTGDTGTVTSAMITDGTIVNADINASAGIVDTKLATISTAGKVSNSATTAVSTNTVNAIVTRDGSGNFSAGTITAALTGNASTATKLSSPRTFAVTGDIAGTVNSDLTSGASIATSIAAGVIIDADVNASAAIGLSKLATGALPSGITVASANIVDGTIVNADVNASAAIAGTKIAPNFGSQTITTTGVISPALGTAAAPSIAFTGDTNTGIFSPGADQVAVATNGSEGARIDSNGRLLVGTSSARQSRLGTSSYQTQFQLESSDAQAGLAVSRFNDAAGSSFFNLQKGRGTNASPAAVIANDVTGNIVFSGWDGATFTNSALIRSEVDGTPGANDMPGRLVFSTTAAGASSPTERMRITNQGQINLNTTSGASISVASGTTDGITFYPAGGSAGVFQASNNTNACAFFRRRGSDGTIIDFRRDTTSVGSISVTTTNTAYNTSSDYRLKENVVDLDGAIDRLKLLPVHRFNFIADPDTVVDGFIAHEAAEVVPECVTGNKDEIDDDGNPVYQGIDQSKIVPLLTAALQEAIAKIETLEQRLTAAGID